jgi:hypothetical protein
MEMTQDDVLTMFRQKAETFGREETAQRDVIMQLAQLLADSNGRLSKENFETLVHAGAVLYKEGLSEFRARSEIAATMHESIEQEKK